MTGENLQFGVIFTADNGELVAVTRENIKETDKYKKVLTDTGKAVRDVGNETASAAKQMSTSTPATRGQASALGQLATQSDVAAVAGRKVVTSQQGLAAATALSEKQMRSSGRASVQLGQQLQDAAIQAQYGASWFTILSSQGSQAAFVLSQMDGGASKFKRGISSAASVLAGPWGLAIAAAVYGGIKLYEMLTDNVEAIGELTPLTNGLAEAQNVLGQMYDLSTGKLKSNNELIKANILLMEIKLRTDAAAAQAEADTVAKGGLSYGANVRGGRGGINAELGSLLGLDDNLPSARANDQKIRDIFKNVKSGTLSGTEALEKVYALPNSIFRDLKFTKTEVLDALGKQLSAKSGLDAADGIRNTRRTGGLDDRFLKPEKERTGRDPVLPKVTLAEVVGILETKLGAIITDTVRPGNASYGAKNSFHKLGQGVDLGLKSRSGKAISKDDIRAVLEAEGIDIKELLGPGDKDHADHNHVAFGRKRVGPDQIASSEQRVENEIERLANFGEQAAEKIAQLNGQFDDTPRAVDQANAAIRETDRLIAELSERQPPGFGQMIADAQKLAPLIRESLKRPILDMIADQERQIAIGDALIDNDGARADSLQFSYGLMQKLGVESEAQLATELARRGITGDQVRALYNQLDVLREQSRELDAQREKQQINLNLLGEFEGGLKDAVRGVLGGDGFGAIGDGIERIFEGYLDALADSFSEDLFGDVFAEQRDKINGLGPVKEAGEQLALQVDAARTSTSALTAQIDVTKNALGTLVTALNEAASDISGAVPPPGSIALPTQAGTDGLPPPIIVNGSRSPTKVIGDAAKGVMQKVFGDKLSGQISGAFKSVMQSAAVGQAISGTLESLGVKQSKLGAQIGAVAGKALGTALGGPIGGKIGQVAGAIIGGTIGGLFKKSKTGSTSISLVDGQLVAGAVGGNSKGLQGKSGALIGNVGGSLASIADQLGGILSDKAAVSIGYDKKGKVVVDPTGRNRTKGSGVQNFGKDGEAAAIAFATLDALKDGAITGLSDKVAQALRSSNDIEKGLREALKVDEIEQILGGFGTASKRAFVDFERQAKERLRIAGKYGFDVVKLEEENAKQRQKLLDGAIDQATGGLKALLEDLLTGEKAPGTLLDRRDALLAKKAELEKAAPGDADAAAKLADVLEQLYEVSLEAFGTAGAQFAGDRSGIKSSAEAIIIEATAQLKAAQDLARKNAGTDSATTDKLLGESNATLIRIQQLIDEGNGQSAALLALMGKFNAGSNYSGSADNFAIMGAYRFAGDMLR